MMVSPAKLFKAPSLALAGFLLKIASYSVSNFWWTISYKQCWIDRNLVLPHPTLPPPNSFLDPLQGSHSFELFKFHDFLHDLFKFSRGSAVSFKNFTLNSSTGTNAGVQQNVCCLKCLITPLYLFITLQGEPFLTVYILCFPCNKNKAKRDIRESARKVSVHCPWLVICSN